MGVAGAGGRDCRTVAGGEEEVGKEWNVPFLLTVPSCKQPTSASGCFEVGPNGSVCFHPGGLAVGPSTSLGLQLLKFVA